jgi:hypothetical protein
MKKSRQKMTVRRVPQGSREAADASVPGTMKMRLMLLSALSLSAWANTGRPFPSYSRAQMPVTKTSLTARSDRD